MAREMLAKMDDILDNLTLGEFLEVLHDRGRDNEAEHYLYVFLLAAASQGVTPDHLLSMTLDDFVNVNSVPRGPAGWNTTWGKNIVRPNG